MSMSLRQKIDAINVRIQALHADTQLALRGEREFGVEQVRALSASIQEMAPMMARAAELRTVEPELAGNSTTISLSCASCRPRWTKYGSCC